MGLKGSLEVLVYRNGPKGLPRSFRNSRLSQGLRPCCEWWGTFRQWNRSPQARRVHWNTSITTLKLERTWRNHRDTKVRISRVLISAPLPRLFSVPDAMRLPWPVQVVTRFSDLVSADVREVLVRFLKCSVRQKEPQDLVRLGSANTTLMC